MEVICSCRPTKYHSDWISCFMRCMRPGQGPAGVITAHSMYIMSLHPSVCARVCEGMMISPGCSMSFSAFRAEADVVVGQNWWVPLPCVRITRWPLFRGTARQIHPRKNGLPKRNERPTSMTVKCTREKRESVFIWPGKAAGQRLIEVQLFPQTSLTLVNGERKHCWIIYCASVAGRMQRGVKTHSY